MEKKVFCAVGQQCKCVKFVSDKNHSDVELVREKIQNICARDKLLTEAANGKSIIIQMKDPDTQIWCDVEDDDEIPDKMKLNIIFLSSSLPESTISILTESNSIVSSKILNKEDVLPVSMKVLYTEPYVENQICPEAEQIDNTAVDEVKENLEVPISDLNFSELSSDASTSTAKSCDHKRDVEVEFSKSTKQKSAVKRETILLGEPLPPLTPDLQQKVDEIGVVHAQKDLIYHWGTHLWQKTAGIPSKTDYKNMAENIVKAYPPLGLKNGDSAIVRATLSSWIRNHRTTAKRQAAKRNANGKIIKSISNADVVTTETSEPPTSISEPPTFDVNVALKELEKRKKEGNTPHIRRLLKITQKNRREWIENTAQSISEIIDRYPQLQNSDLLLFEFYNLKNLTQEMINDNINLMVKKLFKFFEVEESHELSKAMVMITLNSELSKKNKKSIKPLFILKQVNTSLTDIEVEVDESPRCVLYTTEQNIQDAIIVADENIRMHIDNPSIEKVITCLLAAYYVWHIEYPQPYRHMLQFLDHEIFGTVLEKNQVVLKFLRKIDLKLETEVIEQE